MFKIKQMLNRSSRWMLRVLLFGIFISPAAITETYAIAISNEANDDSIVPELPFCDEKIASETDFTKRLLFVSTLDGHVSALDVTQEGSLKWSVDTASPLLSSSIHKLDLTSNGKWVRMIPSLSGGLYKFDGENIEAVPVKAEDLLRSSFKFSDDIVISGGMETRSYGVSAATGKVLYECTLSGCKNYTQLSKSEDSREAPFNPTVDDVLLLRRETQTVRAVDPREGVERWNFSIGAHQMELLRSKDCQGDSKPSEIDTFLADLEFRAVVPEGIVCAYSKSAQKVVWMHRFEFPIVNAWRSDKSNEKVESIDFFEGADWLWPQTLNKQTGVSPSLYLGMFEKQPYIQESSTYRQLGTPTKAVTEYRSREVIPFKPYPATSDGIALIEDMSREDKRGHEVSSTLANSVLYASEYVNGNGFWFFSKTDLNKTQRTTCAHDDYDESVRDDDGSDEEIPIMIRAQSLIYWWKEVVIIMATTGFLVHYFLNNRSSEKEYVVVEKHIPVPFAKEALEGIDYSRSRTSERSSSDSNYSNNSYQSRFMSDYDVVQMLGKGGFGVVFAAKNKVDDCHYAIKRIVLPSRQDSKERVMREVKTLANLDHQNIVRYFNSWIEQPPPGWQEEQDQILKDQQLLSTSIDIGTPSEGTATSFPRLQNGFVGFNDFSIGDFQRDESEDSHIVFQDDPETNQEDSVVVFRESSEATPSNAQLTVSETSAIRRPTTLDLSASTRNLVVEIPQQVTRTYLYIQMQLCQKQSLASWLSQKGYQERKAQVVPIFEQIVCAVEYVHLKGLIHRDLKPSNIFFALDGQVKIGDFGLVTDMAEETPPTTEGLARQTSRHTQQVGTKTYMSPEQISGKPYNYKVDIFSLGLILFELLVTFTTECERVMTLQRIRGSKFPREFQETFEAEHKLLQIMLSERPDERPTTFGIRARPPLQHPNVGNEAWHFELPPRQDRGRSTSSSIM